MGYPLNKKQVMKELLRCGKDPSYFINTYAKITHPQRGLIPFKLYDFQKDAIENFQSNRFNIILKARQLGISTITAACCLVDALSQRKERACYCNEVFNSS